MFYYLLRMTCHYMPCAILFVVSFPHSGSVSVQVAVEMPFDIKTIESPTHKVKIKVSGELCTVQGTLIS